MSWGERSCARYGHCQFATKFSCNKNCSQILPFREPLAKQKAANALFDMALDNLMEKEDE